MNAPFTPRLPIVQPRHCANRSPASTLLVSAWAVHTCCRVLLLVISASNPSALPHVSWLDHPHCCHGQDLAYTSNVLQLLSRRSHDRACFSEGILEFRFSSQLPFGQICNSFVFGILVSLLHHYLFLMIG